MTKNNEHIWVVEFAAEGGGYIPDTNTVFDNRDGARYYARQCKSAGDQVRVRKYGPVIPRCQEAD